MKPVTDCLPFSTTTTSVPPAASPSAPPLLLGGSSPSNSWFTSPWMSEGRRSPSLLETVNLWLMVVAVRRGSSCHGAVWRGGWQRQKRKMLPIRLLSWSAFNRVRAAAFCRVIRCVITSGPSHQPVSGNCLPRVWVLEPTVVFVVPF